MVPSRLSFPEEVIRGSPALLSFPPQEVGANPGYRLGTAGDWRGTQREVVA